MRELEKDFKQNGGEWKSFKIGELFDVGTGSLLVSQDLKQGNTPRISAKSDNNGILGYFDTESNGEARHCENFISVNFFGDTFYHPYKASLEMKVHTLKLKNGIFTKTSGLFIAGIIKKVFYGKFTYGNQLSSSKLKNEDYYISLPVLPTPCHTEPLGEVSSNIESRFFANAQSKASLENDKINIESNNYQIAFDYMESYIKELEAERLQELEAERLQELEAYLKVTGLNDYTLSQKEKDALKAFENLSTLNERERVSGTPNEVPLKWESFKIGELFEIKPTKAYKMTNTTLFETKGDVPVVTNSSLNNGVSAYVGLEPTEKGNMITYSDTTTSEGIFYQPRDFVGYSHIQGLYPLVHKDKWNRYSLLYFVSVFRKASFGKFDYGNKFNRKIAKEMRVLLPVLPTACHTEPLGEVSQVESKRDFSLATQTQNDKNVESSATQDYQIAFDFIESFIKAIQKECIKSVVLWQEREARAYKQVVETLA